MVLAAALTVSAVLAARLIYRYDLYDREPWFVLAAVMVLGAGAMYPLGDLEDWAIQRIGQGQPSAAQIALVAASCEELARLAIVLGVVAFARRYFNDPMDGLIYGSTAGIGMAVEETFYLTHASAISLGTTVPVEFVRLFGHLFMGGITGFGVGLMRRRGAGRVWFLGALTCVAAGTLFHFTWDLVAIPVSATSGGVQVWPTIVSIGLMLLGMSLYGALVVLGSRWSRQVFISAT